MITKVEQILFSRPFRLDYISFKPGSKMGNKAVAFAHADPRAYQERLSEVFGTEWNNEDTYVILPDRVGVSVKLSIRDTTRTNSGECMLSYGNGKPNENAITTAWAQAFKRSCSAFGLDYLYSFRNIFGEFDGKKFTNKPELYKHLNTKELKFWTALEDEGLNLHNAAEFLVEGLDYAGVYKKLKND